MVCSSGIKADGAVGVQKPLVQADTLGITPRSQSRARQHADGEPTMKLVKRHPSWAIRSMCGVLIFSDPKHPKSPYPWSSVKMMTKFVFVSGLLRRLTGVVPRHAFVQTKPNYFT